MDKDFNMLLHGKQKLPEPFCVVKKIIETFPYKKIDVVPNDYMLYWCENS